MISPLPLSRVANLADLVDPAAARANLGIAATGVDPGSLSGLVAAHDFRRPNVLPNSSSFADWSINSGITLTANAGANPLGTANDAYRVQVASPSNQAMVRGGFNIGADFRSRPWCYSFWMKPSVSGTVVQLYFGANGSQPQDRTITLAGTNWRRVSMPVVFGEVGFDNRYLDLLNCYLFFPGGGPAVDMLLYGPQINDGLSPKAYSKSDGLLNTVPDATGGNILAAVLAGSPPIGDPDGFRFESNQPPSSVSGVPAFGSTWTVLNTDDTGRLSGEDSDGLTWHGGLALRPQKPGMLVRARFAIEATTGGYTGVIARRWQFNRVLTAEEHAGIAAFLAVRPPGPSLVVTDGDSITEGYLSHPVERWADLVRKWIPAPEFINVAVGGKKIADLVSDYPAKVAPLFVSAYRKSVLTIWAGTNDLVAGATASATLTALQSYCALARTTGYQVIVGTTLPRGNGFNGGADANSFEAARLSLNSSIRSGWTSFADGLADVGGHPVLGQVGSLTNNNLYHYDQIHLFRGGQAIAAEVFRAAIRLLI